MCSKGSEPSVFDIYRLPFFFRSFNESESILSPTVSDIRSITEEQNYI